MTTLARLTICLLAVFLAGCVKKPPIVTTIDYGIYDAKIAVDGDWKLGKPESIGSVQDLRIKTTTLRIPARNGIYFGVRAQITNPNRFQSMDVTCSIEHPAFTNPNGETSTGDILDGGYLGPEKSMELTNAYWFFIDSCPFEYVPGKWTFTVKADGKPVFSKTFEVYK